MKAACGTQIIMMMTEKFSRASDFGSTALFSDFSLPDIASHYVTMQLIKFVFKPLTFSCYLFFCSQRSYIDTKGWDVFRTLPPEAATRSEATNSKLYFFSIKLLKVRDQHY